MASVGGQVGFHLLGVGHLEGRLARVADGWCLLESGGHEWMVRLDAIELARGLSARAVPPDAWPVTAKLGFGSALRRVAESGPRCQVRLVGGGQYDVLPRRVGADFLEATTGTHGERVPYRFEGQLEVGQRWCRGKGGT